MGGVTSFIGSVHWWVAAYKYPVALPPFSLPPSAFVLALALLPSQLSRHLTRVHPLERSRIHPPFVQDACKTRRRRRLAPVVDDAAPVAGAREGGAPAPPHIAVVAGVDRSASGPSGAQAAQGLRGFICQVPPPWPRRSSKSLHAGALPPLRGGASALLPQCHHVAAVFAAVCEGYLGMIPHWKLWLHLYRGELFNAPAGAAGVRKPVRAGCLNLVLKTGKT